MKFLKSAAMASASLIAAHSALAVDHSQMDHSQHMHMMHNMKDHQGHNSHSMHYSPLNALSTHSHKAGEWMLSYKYMKMSMNGALNGDSNVDTSEIHSAGYMVAPVSMKTDMHMVSGMYGLGGDYTAMVMVPYLEKEMTMHRNMGGGQKFNTKSEGLGDIKIGVTDSLTRYGFSGWTAYYGISLPTGAIDKDDRTPTSANSRLGYNMQMGSGTFDLTPAITYQTVKDGVHYGAQANAVVRTGENHKGYRLGSEFGLKLWAGKTFCEPFSAGISLNTVHQNEIKGRDSAIAAMSSMSPMMDEDNSGYTKSFVGFDMAFKPEFLKGAKFLIGYDLPVYQKVNGTQGRSEGMLTLALRKSF